MPEDYPLYRFWVSRLVDLRRRVIVAFLCLLGALIWSVDHRVPGLSLSLFISVFWLDWNIEARVLESQIETLKYLDFRDRLPRNDH